ncbi:MAG: hypothetical protein ABIP53_06580, partial [Candidatus Limnocylindrales bacterium]
ATTAAQPAATDSVRAQPAAPQPAVTFFVALIVIDRALVREVVTIGLQALPGGGAIARVLRVPITSGRRGRVRIHPDVPAEETVTAGTSVGAESRATLGGAPTDEALGDV